MAESAAHFQELLERLAAEHDREVRELQAEITRLNESLEDRPQVSDDEQGGQSDTRREYSEDNGHGSKDPDEAALAAAFAVCKDMRSDEELTEGSDPWNVKALKTVSENEDTEALALWAKLLDYGRHQVQNEGLPKLHKKWNVDSSKDLGYKMKNLVVHRRSMPAFTQKRFADDDEHGNRRSFMTTVKQTCLPQIPTHPSSKSRLCWDLIGIALLIHDLVMIPMSMFNSELTGLPQEYEKFLGTFDYFSASFWSVDIVINFFTGFHSTSGFVEMSMKAIAIHYMRTWFPLDMCIVGIDWTMTALNQGGPTDFMRLGKTFSRLARLVRLLRFMKMNKQMSELLSRINSEYVLTVIGLVRLVVMIVIVNHYIACFWYGLSKNIQGAEETWVNYYLIKNGKYDLAWSYTTSLHWSLTQFTPASMEIFPHNAYERAFNVVVIICGFVIFSSFVSSITGAMNHIRNINARAVEQDSMIRHYFSENNIPHVLASRVWHFVRQKRVSGKRLRAEELPILQQLPVRLRDELRQEVYTPHLLSHPLLRLYWRCTPAAVRKLCLKAVIEVNLKSGKDLKLDADNITKMIFVLMGSLEYHLFAMEDEDVEFPPTVDRGSWACEAALWADHASIEGHFVAAPGGADLALLDAESFRNIACEFTDSMELLVRYSTHFMERFNAAMLDDHSVRGNILFNDEETAKELSKHAEGEEEARSTGLNAFSVLRASMSSARRMSADMDPLDEPPHASVVQPEMLQMPVLSAGREEGNMPSAYDEGAEKTGEEQITSDSMVEVDDCREQPVREFREQSI